MTDRFQLPPRRIENPKTVTKKFTLQPGSLALCCCACLSHAGWCLRAARAVVSVSEPSRQQRYLQEGKNNLAWVSWGKEGRALALLISFADLLGVQAAQHPFWVSCGSPQFWAGVVEANDSTDSTPRVCSLVASRRRQRSVRGHLPGSSVL